MKKYAETIIIGLLIVVVMLGCLTISFIDDARAEERHVWQVQTIDGDEVKVCEICGEIRHEHVHSWKLEKAGDDFVTVCEKCGETNK